MVWRNRMEILVNYNLYNITSIKNHRITNRLKRHKERKQDHEDKQENGDNHCQVRKEVWKSQQRLFC